MGGGTDRSALDLRDATLPLIVATGWLYGLVEFVRQRWIAPSPPGIPGDGGGDALAYLALGVAAFGLPALIALIASRGRRFGSWLAWVVALAPTLAFFLMSVGRLRRAPWAVTLENELRWGTVSLCALLIAAAAAVVVVLLTRRLRVAPRLWIASAVIVVAAPIALSWRLGLPSLPPAPGSAGESRPNVVLLTIDTLRADAVREVTSAWPSAELDRIVVSDATANSSWTRPAMASLFSGVVPTGHGADDVKAPSRDVAWFVEDMREAGYRTMAVVANPHLRRRFGFDRGFETYEHFGELEWLEPIARSFWAEWWVGLQPHERDQATADRLIPRAEAALDAYAGDGPWLLWVHLVDPHIPYHLRGADGALVDEAPGAWIEPLRPDMEGDLFRDLWGARRGDAVTTPAARRALHRLYGTEVDFALSWSARLLRHAGAVSGERPLLWLMTSDHGEEFWDDGGFEHGHTMHASVTEVPLWVGGNVAIDGANAPRRLIDVGPWLFEQIDLDPMRPRPGSGLLDEDLALTPFALGTPTANRHVLAEGMLYGPARTLLRWPDGTAAEREDLRNAIELRVAADSAAVDSLARDLLIQLDLWRERNATKGRAVDLSPDLVRQLQAIGYVQ